jgi:hypothetical protein
MNTILINESCREKIYPYIHGHYPCQKRRYQFETYILIIAFRK